MLIPVMYKNGNHDQVKHFKLSELIANNEISKFKRSSGWVTIGIDRIRDTRKSRRYTGQESRREETREDLIDIF
jgi:hypothetical protein